MHRTRCIGVELRRRLAGEDGVVLVLVAICLVVFLGAAALAIDVSSFYGAQRKAQAAADAAALAAAHDLPSNTTQATTDVQSYVAKNDPGASASIAYPTSRQIKVTVNTSTPTFFARIWGRTSQNISASATAGAANPAPNAAVFANDTTCGTGITFTGTNSVTVNGSAHSNGSLTFGGSANETISGSASYGGPSGCAATTSSGTSVAGGLWNDPTPEGWPKDYSSLAALCTASPTPPGVIVGNSFSWGGNGVVQIPTGIYCASTISITGNVTVTGTATFIATSIDISGNSTFQVSPDSPDLTRDLPAGSTLTDLIAYQTGSSQMRFQGSGFNSDTVFAPNATVVVDGNSVSSVTGLVEAQDVQFAGTASLTITGDGPTIPGDSGATLTG